VPREGENVRASRIEPRLAEEGRDRAKRQREGSQTFQSELLKRDSSVRDHAHEGISKRIAQAEIIHIAVRNKR